jgi:hypothetical protein
MPLDRADGDDQPLGNLLVGGTASQQAQHFQFPHRELFHQGRSMVRGLRDGNGCLLASSGQQGCDLVRC